MVEVLIMKYKSVSEYLLHSDYQRYFPTGIIAININRRSQFNPFMLPCRSFFVSQMQSADFICFVMYHYENEIV